MKLALIHSFFFSIKYCGISCHLLLPCWHNNNECGSSGQGNFLCTPPSHSFMADTRTTFETATLFPPMVYVFCLFVYICFHYNNTWFIKFKNPLTKNQYFGITILLYKKQVIITTMMKRKNFYGIKFYGIKKKNFYVVMKRKNFYGFRSNTDLKLRES